MHQHHVDGLGQGVQAPADGFLAGGAAGDDQQVGAFGQRVLVQQVADLGGAVRRGDDHDDGDGAGGGHRPYGVDEHGCAAERAERLGGARAQPHAASGGRDHGRGPEPGRTGGVGGIWGYV